MNNRLYNEELNQRLKIGVAEPLHKFGGPMFKELDERLNDLIAKCDKEMSSESPVRI